MGIISQKLRALLSGPDKEQRALNARAKRRARADEKRHASEERRKRRKAKGQRTCWCGCWAFPHRFGSCATGCRKNASAQTDWLAGKAPDAPVPRRWAVAKLDAASRRAGSTSSRAVGRRRRGKRKSAGVPF